MKRKGFVFRAIIRHVCAMVLLVAMMFLTTPQYLKAAVVQETLALDLSVKDWAFDKENDMFYAISNTEILMVIDGVSMECTQKIVLAGQATDIILDNGKLYVALGTKNQIDIYDASTLLKEKTLITSKDASTIAKIDNFLFYAEGDQWCELYRYDLLTDTDKRFTYINNIKYFYPMLAIDTEKHTLYVAERGSTSSDLYAYNTDTAESLGVTTYNESYGFEFPYKSLVLGNDEIFYAGYSFDKLDIAKMEGSFSGGGDIVNVTSEFVIGTSGIYDSENNRLLGTYPAKTTISKAEFNDTAMYLYSSNDNTLRKYKNTGNNLTKDTIIKTIGGTVKKSVTKYEKANELLPGYRLVDMKEQLDGWIKDEENNKLYAFSKKEKAVFMIDSETLDIEDSYLFKSAPSHVLIEGDKLYVALYDICQIVTISIESGAVSDTYYTKYMPSQLVKDNEMIYYSSLKGRKIRAYDIEKRTDSATVSLTLSSSYEVKLAINKEDKVLYVGESGRSSSYLYSFDLENYRMLGKSDAYYYPEGDVFYDGERVYYGGCAIDKSNLRKVYGEYGDEEDILLVTDKMVYTYYSFYDKYTFKDLDVDGDYYMDGDLLQLSTNGAIIIYDSDERIIIAEKLGAVAYVYYIWGENDSDFSVELVMNKTLLSVPKDPVKSGYVFEGWFKDEDYKTPWNFEKDIVDGTVFLFAKWITNPATVNNVKLQSYSNSTIELSWDKVKTASGYEIYRSEDNKEYYPVGTTAVAKHFDENVDTSKSYYYKVRAYTEGYTTTTYGSFSKAINVTAAPRAVKDVVVRMNSESGAYIGWGVVDGAAGYELYRAVGNGSYELIAKNFYTGYYDESVTKHNVYKYRVRAYITVNGITIYGNEVSVEFKPGFEAPTSLKIAINGDRAVELKWTAVSGAKGYQVYRSTSKNSGFTKIADTRSTKYADSALTSNKTYYYRVNAYFNSNGDLLPGNYASISGKAGMLSKPVIKAESAGLQKIKISWKAVSGAVKYEIYRSESKDGTYSLLKTTTETSCLNTRLSLGATYYYKVRAVKTSTSLTAKSEFSTATRGTAKILPPENIKIASTAYNQIKLTWNKNIDGTIYYIYRSTSKNGKYKLIFDSAVTYYVDNNVKTGTTYYYKIKCLRGYDTSYVSDYSAPISAKPALSKPSNVKVKKVSTTVAQVSYNTVSGSTSYEIYRSTSQNGTYTKVGTTKEKTLKNKNLQKGKTYYYKVRAYRLVNNKKVYSDYSKPVAYTAK